MTRILGVLLLVLSLLPRLAAEGGVVLSAPADGRAAVAVAGNVEHFSLTAGGGLERLLAGGSNRSIGNAPIGTGCLPSLPLRDGVSETRILPPSPALRCRRHAELLPYHANAPPPESKVG